MVTKRKVEDFIETPEKPALPAEVKPPVEAFIEGLPAWKRRNLEPKHRGTQFRCSESQLQLLRIASLDQEISIQRILERVVWPILEEQYGPTETESPS